MNRTRKLRLFVLCLLAAVDMSGKPQVVEAKSLPDRLVVEVAERGLQIDLSLPDVTVLEPAEQSTRTESENVRLRVLVRSAVPLVGVTVMRNGVASHKVKIDGSFHERGRYVLDVMIQLQPGANAISIVAENEKASSKANVREIVYEPNAQSKPTLRVLAIGVSKSGGSRSSSRFASADAQAFAKVMSTQAQAGLFANVETKLLLDSDATRQEILEALKWLRGSTDSANDVRVLFLSGSLATDYIDNTAYFLTSQFEPKADLAIGNVKLTSFWQVLDRGTGNTIIFANTDWVEGVGRYSLDRFTQSVESEFNNYFASDGGATFLPESNWNHSAFTTALLEGLEGKADIISKDTIIDTHELQTWMRSRVEQLTGGKQLPSIQVPAKRVPLFKLTR